MTATRPGSRVEAGSSTGLQKALLHQMSAPESYSFTRYLTSKRTVDDRALNQHVWDAFTDALTERQTTADRRLKVLEVGAGSGTMIERCLESDLLTRCEYIAIDTDEHNIVAAAARLPERAALLGFTPTESDDGGASKTRERAHRIEFERVSSGANDAAAVQFDTVKIELEQADMFEYAARPEKIEQIDLVIAHAFLDLVDVPRVLTRLRSLLRAQALLYLTINFDGATILQPEIDHDYDALVERLYHETMDQRVVAGKPSGDSQTGRHMFGHLRAAGMDILAAGSSDWVVFAGSEGYVEDEAYFLHFIVDTMHGALAGHPGLETDRFREWIRKRHEQIEHGELVYIAHQIDFLAQLRT